jgi:hypothetical protein
MTPTPLHIAFNLDVNGLGVDLFIRSFQKPLTLPHYLEIIDTWLKCQQAEHAHVIAEFEALKKSGKIVSINSKKHERK